MVLENHLQLCPCLHIKGGVGAHHGIETWGGEFRSYQEEGTKGRNRRGEGGVEEAGEGWGRWKSELPPPKQEHMGEAEIPHPTHPHKNSSRETGGGSMETSEEEWTGEPKHCDDRVQHGWREEHNNWVGGWGFPPIVMGGHMQEGEGDRRGGQRGGEAGGKGG